MLATAPLSGGFVLDDCAVITENELYAATARPRYKRSDARRANLEGWLRDLSELKIGDPVVHENHGIGRYLGLVHMDLGDGNEEFLHLEYANERQALRAGRPARSHLALQRRRSRGRAAAHASAPASGTRRRSKAAEQVRDTAAELLHLYAQRAARQGHEFSFKTARS